jgi:uncharacterized protein YndB with AHSA1/START domain
MEELPPLIASATIKASQEAIWAAWTTSPGIKSFLAPDCKIDLRVGGSYEVYFNPQADPQDRGSIGSVILAIQPMNFFSFTWRNPPSISAIRWQFTQVSIQINDLNQKHGQVILTQDGWGTGPDWKEAYRYFKRAWQKVVMPRLVKRFESGPIIWDEI